MNVKKDGRSSSEFLQWVHDYFGLWSLTCTAEHEHSTPKNIADLIEKLSAAGLDELIFVALMVHRDEPFMVFFYRIMFFDLISERWESEREHIIDKIIQHLQ